jgi:hypothetical protein
MSQLLTLYTTPVVYLYFDSLQRWWDKDGSKRAIAPETSIAMAGPLS